MSSASGNEGQSKKEWKSEATQARTQAFGQLPRQASPVRLG